MRQSQSPLPSELAPLPGSSADRCQKLYDYGHSLVQSPIDQDWETAPNRDWQRLAPAPPSRRAGSGGSRWQYRQKQTGSGAELDCHSVTVPRLLLAAATHPPPTWPELRDD